MRIELEDKKYTVIFESALPNKPARFHALRYGEEWRELSGDDLILALACRVNFLEEKLRAIPNAETAPDYCYNADDWETTYTWENSYELTMDLAPGDSLEIGCLKQLPTRWVACIIRDDERKTLWFDTQEEMEEAVRKWKESSQ